MAKLRMLAWMILLPMLSHVPPAIAKSLAQGVTVHQSCHCADWPSKQQATLFQFLKKHFYNRYPIQVLTVNTSQTRAIVLEQQQMWHVNLETGAYKPMGELPFSITKVEWGPDEQFVTILMERSDIWPQRYSFKHNRIRQVPTANWHRYAQQ